MVMQQLNEDRKQKSHKKSKKNSKKESKLEEQKTDAQEKKESPNYAFQIYGNPPPANCYPNIPPHNHYPNQYGYYQPQFGAYGPLPGQMMTNPQMHYPPWGYSSPPNQSLPPYPGYGPPHGYPPFSGQMPGHYYPYQTLNPPVRN